MKILICGDIVALPGRQALYNNLPRLKHQHNIDFVITNVDNVANGFGITKKYVTEFINIGVNCMTGGNHLFDQKDIQEVLNKENRLLRAANISSIGNGHCVYTINDKKILVIHLMGQDAMPIIGNNPYICLYEILHKYKLKGSKNWKYKIPQNEFTKIKNEKNTNTANQFPNQSENDTQKHQHHITNAQSELEQEIVDCIIVDVHAEYTSEKNAIAHFLDGQVSIVFGTHTHIPTADNRILEFGTAFQTDVGMCGDYNSIIGMSKHGLILRKIHTFSKESITSANGIGILSSLLVEIDDNTGLAATTKRIHITQDGKDFFDGEIANINRK